MKKIIFFLLLSLSISLFSLLAKADYIKANYGISNLSDKVTTTNTGSPTIDTDDQGFIVNAGLNITGNLGAEIMYYELGTTSIKGSKYDVISIDGANYKFSSAGTLSNDTSGYGVGIFYSSEQTGGLLSVSASGRIGLHNWDRSGSTTIIEDPASTLKAQFYNDGVDLYYGIELGVGITENVSISLTADGMSFADEGVSTSEMGTLIGIGIKSQF